MIGIFAIFWLVAWVKALSAWGRPFLCAIFYTAPFILYSLITGQPFVMVAIGGAIGLCYNSLYFWLLDYFEESFWYWIILVVGFVGPGFLIFLPALFS
jgi:hypothetical protein